MTIKIQTISKDKQKTYEKDISRNEYLREWRKNNPGKVKEHRKKADQKYYLKNAQKYRDREKINYYKYALWNHFPNYHFCYDCDTTKGVFIDHSCFVKRFKDWKNRYRVPLNIWRTIGEGEPGKKQIARNIRLVKTLQNHRLIPKFKIEEPEYYLRVRYYHKERSGLAHSIYYINSETKKLEVRKGVNANEEYDKFDKKMNNLFSKEGYHSYEKHEGFEEYVKVWEK